MKGSERGGKKKKGKKKSKGGVALDPAAKEELELNKADRDLKKKTDALTGIRTEDELSRLMAVVDADPSHEVCLANLRRPKKMADMAVSELERLERSARAGKPSEQDKYWAARSLARAGLTHLFFSQIAWLSFEHTTNPYVSRRSVDDQGLVPDPCTVCTGNGVSCAAVNRVLEEMNVSTTQRMSSDIIMERGGPALKAELGDNSLLELLRGEPSLFKVFYDQPTGHYEASINYSYTESGTSGCAQDRPGVENTSQVDGQKELQPRAEPNLTGSNGAAEAEPQPEGRGEADIPVPADNFDDLISCADVSDIYSSVSITTPAGETYKMTAEMLELKQYLRRIGMGSHVFGLMLDQSAFSIDDLTFIDNERDLIDMGFNQSQERELLLLALTELKASKARTMKACDSGFVGNVTPSRPDITKMTHIDKIEGFAAGPGEPSDPTDGSHKQRLATDVGGLLSPDNNQLRIQQDKAECTSKTVRATPLAELKSMTMKQLRARAFALELTEDDLDYALDEATEQDAKPKDMITKAVILAEHKREVQDLRLFTGSVDEMHDHLLSQTVWS